MWDHADSGRNEPGEATIRQVDGVDVRGEKNFM